MIVLKFGKDSNKIPGSSGIQDHEEWIGVDSVTFTVMRNVTFPTPQAVERKPGNPQFQEVNISRPADKSSPLLWDQATHGQSLELAEIRFLQSGTSSGDPPVAFLVIKLHAPIISSYVLSGAGESDPMETVTINYSQVEYQYDPHSGTAAEAGENKTWSMVTGTTSLK